MAGKVEDVAHGRGAKRVDRLGVVADDGQASPVRPQRQQHRGLEPVGVLIFVDQHVIEALRDLLRDRRLLHHVRPVEQEIVVIEHLLALLDLHILAEQLSQLVAPHGAPRKKRAEHLLERGFAVHRARIDREARALGREALLGPGKSEVVADQVHQVGGILAVVDGEGAREPDVLGVLAQQPRADGMERSRPHRLGRAAAPPRARPLRMRSTRRVISAAARREKVKSMMRRGSAPFSIRNATRCASVEVLPEPAPAMMSSGPASPTAAPPCSTARRCCGLSFSKRPAAIGPNHRCARTATESRFRFCSQGPAAIGVGLF